MIIDVLVVAMESSNCEDATRPVAQINKTSKVEVTRT